MAVPAISFDLNDYLFDLRGYIHLKGAIDPSHQRPEHRRYHDSQNLTPKAPPWASTVCTTVCCVADLGITIPDTADQLSACAVIRTSVTSTSVSGWLCL